MTREEILTELERFKDRVNADGKATLDRLKDALLPYLNPEEKYPEVKTVVKVEEKVVPMAGDRRSEDRDPMEVDQHEAEKLKLTTKPHRR